MSFAGQFKLSRREGYQEFAAATGATPEQIAKGESVFPVTEIAVNGETYTVSRKFPQQTTTNTFTLGQKCDLNLVEGKSAKDVVVTMQGGKLHMQGAKFSCIAEIEGGNLKETLTLGDKTMTRYSTRQ